MTNFAQLEAHIDEIATAVKSLVEYGRNIEAPTDFLTGSTSPSLVPPEAFSEAHRARRSIMANVAKLPTLLAEPTDFLQQLAVQVRHSYPSTLLDTDAELT